MVTGKRKTPYWGPSALTGPREPVTDNYDLPRRIMAERDEFWGQFSVNRLGGRAHNSVIILPARPITVQKWIFQFGPGKWQKGGNFDVWVRYRDFWPCDFGHMAHDRSIGNF